MWPFDRWRDDEVDEMRQCDHPEWENEHEQVIHPRTVYAEDDELFINRLTLVHKTCPECGYTELDQQNEERVYLSVDRVEGQDDA